jgi:HK97 family phage portal protein
VKITLFGKVIEIKNSTSDLPSCQNDSAWAAYLGGKGYYVSANTALKVSAVLRCVDVVAKTMASLPLNLYQYTQNGREKAEKHPLYKLLYRLPNKHTTSYEFWHMYIFNLMLTRGAFAKIVRDRSGFIRELWNIPTANVSDVHVNKVNGERYIIVTLGDGATETLREGDFMYTPNLRFTSDTDPENPILIASEVLGLTMALNGYAKDFFENGSNLGGFVEHPESMTETAYTRFKESWQASYAGVLNQHKVGFLEEGMKFNPIGRNPEESQALESRKFAIAEVCRLFGVPPHKVFDLDRATFSNIEQQNIEYVQESITPMAVKIEQTVYKDLLLEPEQRKYFAKFNVNALMRGDIATRSAYYHNARQDGWLNADDIRELEDMNKLPEGQGGDTYAVNGNMIPLSSIPQNLPKGAQKGGN